MYIRLEVCFQSCTKKDNMKYLILFTLLFCVESTLAEDVSSKYTTLKLDVTSSDGDVLGSATLDLPHTLNIGGGQCNFHRGHDKISLLCLAKDDLRILYSATVKCSAHETDTLKVINTETNKVVFITWSCYYGETA